MFPADPVGRKLRVPPLADLFGVRSGQHFNDMVQPDTKAAPLADTIDAREKLLRREGAVVGLARGQAIVTAAAVRLGELLAKIFEQGRPPAAGTLGVVDHLGQLLAGDLLFLGVGFLGDELLLLDDVAGAEEQQAFAGQAVASGPAGFLVVTFKVLGQVVMDDEPDVGLVDAHAEGDGGANDPDLVAQKLVLAGRAVPGLHSSVIRGRLDPIGLQALGQAFGALAALTIDDPALLEARADERQRLVVRAGLRSHPIRQVGAIETGQVATGLAQMQLLNDVPAHALRGRGGQRHHRHFRKKAAQLGKLAVFGPEIMAPFADAMGFVHGDEIRLPVPQIFQEPRKHQPFGRHVEEPKFAVMQPAKPLPGLARRQRRVQQRRRHSTGLERIHLVLHQSDERRHHDRQTRPDQRGQLKAQRLAPSRRQQGKHIFSCQGIADNFFLQRAKRGKAEVLLQQR